MHTCETIPVIKTTSITPERFPVPPSNPSLLPPPTPLVCRQTLICFLSLQKSVFSRLFHKWSHSVCTHSFFPSAALLKVVPGTDASEFILVIAEQHSVIGIYHNLPAHSSVHGHLSCFQFSAIMNKATVNFHIQVSIWIYASIFLW